MKINWSLVGIIATGVGFLCDHMSSKEAEIEEIRKEEELDDMRHRLAKLEAKFVNQVQYDIPQNLIDKVCGKETK